MAIRRSLFLSFAAAAVAVGGAASSAVAQQGHASYPTPPHHDVADGLILSADDVVLGPGETLLDGGLGAGVAPGPHPALLEGHQPMFPPGSEMGIGMPCPTCEPGHYANVEALYFKHGENRRFIGSDAFIRSEEFDYEWAGRLTFGRAFDCVNGYEFVYAGPLEWEMGRTATYGAVGDTTKVGQAFEARMNSLELNRTYFGWDVVKATHGIRAILYEENSLFTRTTDIPPVVGEPDNGTLRESVDNLLIGPQIGLELYYPISNRLYVGSKIKGALFANFVETDTVVDAIGGSNDDVDIAGMFELGTNMGFRVTDSITATIGYELWYLMGVGTSYSQIPDSFAFRNASASDEVLMHGVTAGVHVRF